MMDENNINNNNDDTNVGGNNPQENPTPNEQPTETTPNDNGGQGVDDTTPNEPIVYDFSTAFEGGQVDEGIATEFSKMLNGVGATQEQAIEFAKFGSQYATKVVEAYEQQRQEAVAKQAEMLKKEAIQTLGADYKKVEHNAAVALEWLEKNTAPNIRELLDKSEIGNHVELIRAFEKLGELLGEDNNSGGGKPANNNSDDAMRKSLYPSMFK